MRKLGEDLLIPIHNSKEQLVSLQFISPNGKKKFKAGGKVKGCFSTIGILEGIVFICEGYATAATIHQATGFTAIVAFNANNLEPVVRTIKSLNIKNLKIIVAADNDYKNKINTGLEKGMECVKLHDVALIHPNCVIDKPHSDFNDLGIYMGYGQLSDYLYDVVEELSYE